MGNLRYLGYLRMSCYRKGVKPEQIISINFEELEYENLRDYHAYQYILERMQPDEMNYIFL